MKKLIAFAGVSALLILATSCEKNIQQKNDATQHGMMDAAKAIGGKVVLAMAVPLSGANEVPANSSATKGVAVLQVTETRKLYSKVQISSLANDDAILFGHIHKGATGVNGGVLITLLHGPEDVGQQMVMDLTEAQYQSLLNDALYVNIHSTSYPGGIVRGQIR
jgi:hypothetical protein